MTIPNRARFYLGIALLFVALATGGCATLTLPRGLPTAIPEDRREAHNLAVFDRVWGTVDRRFFDEDFNGIDWSEMRERFRSRAAQAPDDEALYAALNTMLGELQTSHTVALTPQQAFEFRRQQRAAFGFRFRNLDNQWVVTDVLPGSPAEAAGLRPGWIVISREGTSIGEAPRFSIQEGRTVTYEFLDDSDGVRTLVMTASTLSTVDRQQVRRLDDGTVYLRFDVFDGTSRRWLREQLKVHAEAPGVVIDLRQNHGGQALSLLLMLGEFFPGRVPVGTFIRRGGRESEWDSYQWMPARYTGEVVVLVDAMSASCAEIFAHVLSYNQRAVVVGRTTAGLVVPSRFYGLPGGGMLQVPQMDYQGLDGRRLEGVGVVPDIVVPLTVADLRAGIDPDLEAARSILRDIKGLQARN